MCARYVVALIRAPQGWARIQLAAGCEAAAEECLAREWKECVWGTARAANGQRRGGGLEKLLRGLPLLAGVSS
jgi:hypothetical protein